MMAALTYWPTVLWLFGYLEFWLQLGPWRPWLGISVGAAVFVAVISVLRHRSDLRADSRRLGREWLGAPLLFKLCFVFSVLILTIGLIESRHPPHLIQEGDTMVYHVSIPRQHLLARASGHLPWSVADLFPMPLQWGFAPAWLMNDTLNKGPQAATALWLLVLMIGLGRRATGEGAAGWQGWVPGLALMSSHGVAIQLGTAMMDIPILYCAVAAWHAHRTGRTGWAALHLALFATAKSFSPPQTALILAIAAVVMLSSRSSSVRRIFENTARPALIFLAFFLTLMARSAVVSYQVAGTPLFPFFTCMDAGVPGCEGDAGTNIRDSAHQHMGTRDAYGNGRGVVAFVKHLWRVAVPTQGVNNEFDYPLGLPWLLGTFMLVVSLILGFREKRVTPESAIALAFWAVWWAGSHQSRWLYPMIAFAWLGTIRLQRMIQPRLLLGALVVSAAFSLISQVRSLRPFLFLSSEEIQAQQAAKVTRDSRGNVTDVKTLYVNEPILEHKGTDPLWIIQK